MAEQIAKHYITPDSLRSDSYKLAMNCVLDGFKPDIMVALWRGGAPVGCYMHEYFKLVFPTGNTVDHIAIRTSRYTGIDTTHEGTEVQVHQLGYLEDRLNSESKVLLVDDVFDTGISMTAVFNQLAQRLGPKMPKDIRVATVYYKPTRNQTTRVPNYYINETTQWIVFPHELEGMSLEEIRSVHSTQIAHYVATGISAAKNMQS